jgi:hypothetical protein
MKLTNHLQLVMRLVNSVAILLLSPHASLVSKETTVLHFIITYQSRLREWDSSVSIVTRYGLEGPGIESRWGRDFPHLSRPALG